MFVLKLQVLNVLTKSYMGFKLLITQEGLLVLGMVLFSAYMYLSPIVSASLTSCRLVEGPSGCICLCVSNLLLTSGRKLVKCEGKSPSVYIFAFWSI